MQSTESAITLDENNIVTSKVFVCTVRYYYDAEDGLVKKRIQFANGSEHTVNYEKAENDSQVVKFTAGGRTVTSHSKTDSFGRKEFDELQLGTASISRQFYYHAGVATDEHKNKSMVKSAPTTQLVSRILLSNGHAISYEYDEEERITKVEDSVDGITIYTYDALGQLETETRDGITTKFKYDNYGNILAKGVVDETGEIAEASKVTYVYGDDTWKDLLTAYNGQSITYDAQGNPTSYLGHTLTWEKGRQLKSFDNIAYTYNANGIRTSKTVNGVRHDYVLDGAKILRETWENNTLVPLYDNEDSVCGIEFNNTAYYFLKNLQGDIIAITNGDGDTVARYSYDAWGVPTIIQDFTDYGIASINPYRYRGYYYDEETGMYYLQSRYYNPNVGRFVNGDDANITMVTDNLFSYCKCDPVDNLDEFGYASYKTRNKRVNALIALTEKLIPNFYTDDFRKKEKTIFKAGLNNLNIKIGVGMSLQTNKNALFGFLFKRGTLEVSSYLGINEKTSLAFSVGIDLRKAYLKAGICICKSNKRSGVCYGAYIQLSIPTWILAAVAVVTCVVSVYAPVVAACIAKIISIIRSSIRVAAPVLVPLIPSLVANCC